MKITALLFTLAAAANTDDGSNDGIKYDHHLNTAGHAHGEAPAPGHDEYDAATANADTNRIHDENIRPDGQYGSHRNQITRYPTKQPTAKSDAFDNMQNDRDDPNTSRGDTDAIADQTGVGAVPTKEPTAFPTKKNHDGDSAGKWNTETDGQTIGSFCKDGDFERPVGWVGAGAGDQFCNVWKCNPSSTDFTKGAQGHFTKQIRKCSVDQHKNSTHTYCSHTYCHFGPNDFTTKNVINVHSDHRETSGGFHICGFAKVDKPNNMVGEEQGGLFNQNMGQHLNENTQGEQSSDRPACDCVCHGDRRQDAVGFHRELNQNRIVAEPHDATTSQAGYDADHNHNNFYSKHSHAKTYVETAVNKDVETNNVGTSTRQTSGSTDEMFDNVPNANVYNNGEYVAHYHKETQNTDPYMQTHKSE